MPSFIAITGRNESSCGYCHSKADTSISFGAWAYAMSCQDYQDLIDRGWRRSGKYLYKPTLHETCCPAYTIRLEVGKFDWSKSHKKVIKRVRGWVKQGSGDRKRAGAGDGGEGSKVGVRSESVEEGDSRRRSSISETEQPPPQDALQEPASAPPTGPPAVHTSPQKQKARPTNKTQSVDIVMRDVSSHAASSSTSEQSKKTKPVKKPLPTSTPLSKPQEFLSLIREAEAPSGKPEGHQLRVVLERSSYQEETYTLFRKYQIAIHKDPPTKLSPQKYKQFLVDTPLQFENPKTPNAPGYGSFHQKYYTNDNKLIAVGVIDILPYCVSSVYFMYDPDYAFLSLGTYSALREIGFTMLLEETLPELKYYYMGYYIHSCEKMRYKAHYRPSSLLCPQTYTWVSADPALPILDKRPVEALSIAIEKTEAGSHRDEDGDQSSNTFYRPPNAVDVTDGEVGDLMNFSDGMIIPFKVSDAFEEVKVDLKEFYAMLGPELMKRMVIVA